MLLTVLLYPPMLPCILGGNDLDLDPLRVASRETLDERQARDARRSLGLWLALMPRHLDPCPGLMGD